jgi:hypothetical protein
MVQEGRVAVARTRVNPFSGEWQITSTDMWDAKELGAARLTFDCDRSGELEIIAIAASVDYRLGTRDGEPIVEFSWEGDDDGSPISGRGWARATAGGLTGGLFIHGGDESTFTARRPDKQRRRRCRRS